MNDLVKKLSNIKIQQDCEYIIRDKNTLIIRGIVYEPHLYHILKVVKKEGYKIFFSLDCFIIYK